MDVIQPWSLQRRLLHALAITTMASTFVVLFAGGLVTSNKVGMAVPDWPTTFQENPFLYWFFDKDVGIQMEHSHRLIASGIGLLTILLGVCIGVIERRMWVLGLGALAILLVVAQGILGGMRVVLNDWVGTDLAALHGCMAQLFFAVTVTLSAVTSRWWVESESVRHPDGGRLRGFTVGLAIVVYVQIVLGATVRHYGSGPMFLLHFGLAGILLLGVIWTGLMVLTEPPLRSRLGVATVILLFAVGLQVMLGLAAMGLTGLLPPNERSITTVEALTTTSHMILGSLVFATCVHLSLRVARLLRPLDRERAEPNSNRVLESVA